MEGLGYSAAKPLKVKVSTRNIPLYRDPAVIFIDQMKAIHIDGELEVIDTTIWHAKVQRKDYAVGLNTTGVGVDDPDVNLVENYTCASDRNYTQYCNKEVDALIFAQSQARPIWPSASSWSGRPSARSPRTWRVRSSCTIAPAPAGNRTPRASSPPTTASTTPGASRMRGWISRGVEPGSRGPCRATSPSGCVIPAKAGTGVVPSCG